MNVDLQFWNHDENGLWSCELRCDALILQPQVYPEGAGWRWRVFAHYTSDPIAQDLQEHKAPWLAARASIEYLQQWSDELRRSCSILTLGETAIMKGGA